MPNCTLNIYIQSCVPTAAHLHMFAGDRNNYEWSLVTRLVQRNEVSNDKVSGLSHSSYSMFTPLDSRLNLASTEKSVTHSL